MKKNLMLSGCLALAAMLALLTGCDTESADSPVSISPTSVTLQDGQSAAFTASGGFDYAWSLEPDDLGTLNRRTGPTVTYTAHVDAVSTNAGNRTVTLKVTSTVQGAGAGSTNAAANTAEAYIRHL